MITYQSTVLNIVGALNKKPILIGILPGKKKVILIGIGIGYKVSGWIAAFVIFTACLSSSISAAERSTFGEPVDYFCAYSLASYAFTRLYWRITSLFVMNA